MSYNDDRQNPDASNYPNDGSTAANSRAPQVSQKDPNLQQEPTGAIASDSLAAESLQSGGAFAENDNATPLAVKGASSTLNNTDTSGATTLPPAADATDREAASRQADPDDIKGPGGLKYAEGVGGQGDFSGAHSDQGYTGGPSADRAAQNGSSSGGGEYSTGQTDSTSATSATTSGQDYRANAAAETAPNAFGDFRTEGQLKPKGANLTEGDIPQTKTFTGDVGGPHDPGRLAEQKFQNANADTAGAGGERQYETEQGTGQYDVLSSERAGNQSARD